MTYPARPIGRSINGIQRWRSRSIAEAASWIGIDIDDPATKGILVANDIHFSQTSYVPAITALDPSITAELSRLAALDCWSRVVINGDILTDYANAFGYGPYTAVGNIEIAWANAAMPAFEAVAPLVTVTGNHDSGPSEDPSDSFMAANAPWWVEGPHAWDCGGVHCMAFNATNGADLRPREQGQFDDAIAAVTDDADVIVFIHQPMGSRAVEWGPFKAFETAVPEGFANPLTMVSGHVHLYSERCLTFRDTTIFQWATSCTVAAPAGSGDDTEPALSAIFCKGGRIAGRLSFDGKTGLWFAHPSMDRSNPEAWPDRLAALATAGFTSLAAYYEGEYNPAGKILTTLDTTYRRATTWLAYVTAIKVKFPIPVGATRFWVLHTGSIATAEMSNSDGSWTSVTVPSIAQEMRIFTIPVGLRGGADLYFQMSCNSAIGGWGFA